MIFLILLFYGAIAFYAYERNFNQCSHLSSLLYFSPFIALWVFIIGGQLGVGTDYYSYLDIFEGKKDLQFYANKGEYCFYGIVYLFQSLNFCGQFYFYFFALLNILVYIAILKKTTNCNYALFFFLFVTVSTMVHSQMNGIRQCTAVFFVTLGFVELIQGRKKFFFIYVLMAAGFHISAIAILLLYFLKKVSLSKWSAKFWIFVTAIISFVSLDNIIKDVILILPEYSHYADSEYMDQGVSVLNKMTKLATFPLYYFSISIIDKKNMSIENMRLFQVGIVAYLIKTVCIVSTVTYRFGHFFFILSLIPIFYYLCYLRKKNFTYFSLWCAYLFFLYCLKILLFPSSEYLYNSIFTTYF